MTNATATARRAVQIAAELTEAMRAELCEATERDGALRIPGRHRMSTEGALSRRELIEPGRTVVTDLGRIVRAVLIKGADAVLAYAVACDAGVCGHDMPAAQPAPLTHDEIDVAVQQINDAPSVNCDALAAGRWLHLARTPWAEYAPGDDTGPARRTRSGLIAHMVLTCGADTMHPLVDALAGAR
jgi:hypothetical protein